MTALKQGLFITIVVLFACLALLVAYGVVKHRIETEMSKPKESKAEASAAAEKRQPEAKVAAKEGSSNLKPWYSYLNKESKESYVE